MANDDLTRENEILLENEIRENFGAKIIYIVKNSDLAVKVMKERGFDKKKADLLASHSVKVKEWAAVLGLLPNTPKMKRDLAYLTKINAQLEKYIDSIRDHVTKITHPDLFIVDAFAKLDEQLFKYKTVSDVLRKALQEEDPDHPQFNPDELKRLVDKMSAPLPIQRKNEEGGDIKVALAKIERFRAATAAFYTFWGLSFEDKTAFPGCSKKCLEVALNCLSELEKDYDLLVKDLDDTDENGKRIIQLEDAWNHTMQFAESDNDASLDIDEPDAKRQKIEETKHPSVIRSRVLLTPGRTVISSILPVLKRKRATLVKNKTAPHVVLEFGKAFEMKIYFVPLLVTVRAIDESSKIDQIGLCGGAGLRWPSLHQGLHAAYNRENAKNLTVLGVTGSHASLGPIVAKKLQYASSQATWVLRRCFAETVGGKGAMAKTDFEVEILEVGALVKFLQIARSTYIPDWKDDDC